MKYSTKYALGTVFGLLFAFSAVQGQAQDQSKIRATIPFNFVIGSNELKAGEYVVQQFGSPGSQSLQFRSENGDIEQIGFTVPLETNEIGNHGRLVFHRYGEQYFLSQVWFVGDHGREFIAEALEKKAATEKSTADQMVVASKR